MNNSLKIAVIGAMDCEIASVKKLLKEIKEISMNNLLITTGKAFNHFVILAKSGVGKVNAALTTQYIIDKFEPDIIINTGVAGGLGEKLQIGDVVIGEALVQHDFDASAFGYAKGYLCTGIEPDKPTMFFSDKKLVEVFENSIEKTHKGIIATGDVFVGNKEKKQEIIDEFNAIAVEMEGCAIAQVATANNVPFVVSRAISDLADGTSMSSQNEFEKLISETSSKSVEKVLENIDKYCVLSK